MLLVSISLLHFYWLFGGRWGYLAAIPDRFHPMSHDAKKRNLTRIATLLVALCLLAMAWLMFLKHPFMKDVAPPTKLNIVLKIIGSIFILRAVGDGHILGLFKRKSDTIFAYYDTRLYIPICFFLGLSFWMVAW